MTTIITLDKVNHSFGNEVVLAHVDLKIEQGEIYGLLGPSGSGKTTVVKTIIGALTPSSGKVYVEDTKMPSLKKLNDIGYMAQADALYEELTARENLDFFAKIYGMDRRTRKKRIDQVLSEVDLFDSKEKVVEHFSGGMKRRLSLAVALLHKPRILILDEPTVGIDPVLRNKIWAQFNEMKANGITLIVTTHVMDEAEKCDQLGLLRDGKVLANGTPTELKEQTQTHTIEEAFLYYGGVQ